MSKQPNQTWISELVDAGEKVVLGYEKYLLDEITYKQLAKIILKLRAVLSLNPDQDSLD